MDARFKDIIHPIIKEFSERLENKLDHTSTPHILVIQTLHAICVKLYLLSQLSRWKLVDQYPSITWEDLELMESGVLFQFCGGKEFIEPNPFYWYLDYYSEELEINLSKIYHYLDQLNPHGDLLSLIYESLMPRKDRRLLGEYYTPYFFATYIVQRIVKWSSSPYSRFLDPMCGSGVFLSAVIKNKLESGQLSSGNIFQTFKGFDINPLAALSAKINIVLAFKDHLSVYPKGKCPPIMILDILRSSSKEKFDYIIGNPPWINWEHLPRQDRHFFQLLYDKTYQLFPHKGNKARHGSTKVDISALMTYISIDRYLKPQGILSFILPFSLFKSQASQGFRKFYLPDGTPFKILEIHDLRETKLFKATNYPCLIFCKKGEKTTYPLPYIEWTLNKETNQFTPNIAKNQFASPIHERDSPWMTGSINLLEIAKKFTGESAYRAKPGVCTWLNGVFWVRILEKLENGLVRIENQPGLGRIPVPKVQTIVEEEAVYHLLRGRDIAPWQVKLSNLTILVPHPREKPGIAFSLSNLQEYLPYTYNYLSQFESLLRKRSGYKKYLKSSSRPFYSIYNIGAYTFAPFKVVWREQAKQFVVAPLIDAANIIPDHKLMLVAVKSAEEAFFLTGVLNTSFLKEIIQASHISTQYSTQLLRYLKIPAYNKTDTKHYQIAQLGEQIYIHKSQGLISQIQDLYQLLDDMVLNLTNSVK
ncbi:MAG: Eco57I restriction-modification methylase domain-containing protein [Promethearchaeota archaeon]